MGMSVLLLALIIMVLSFTLLQLRINLVKNGFPKGLTVPALCHDRYHRIFFPHNHRQLTVLAICPEYTVPVSPEQISISVGCFIFNLLAGTFSDPFFGNQLFSIPFSGTTFNTIERNKRAAQTLYEVFNTALLLNYPLYIVHPKTIPCTPLINQNPSIPSPAPHVPAPLK